MTRLITRTYISLGLFLGGGIWVVVGCMQPTTMPITQSTPPKAAAPADEAPVESNIVRVIKFFSSDPWLNFEADGTKKIDGVRFTVYLEGAGKPTGVFGTGRVVVNMYLLERDMTGKETAAPIHEWDMPSEQTYPWRAKQKTALGWGYGLRLHWDPKLEVAGKQVAFVVKYVREDGRVVTSSRQVVKVPSDDGTSSVAAAMASTGKKPAVVTNQPASRPPAKRTTTSAERPVP